MLSTEINQLPPYESARLSVLLGQVVREYFKDKSHREEFQKWHLETYGEPYEFQHTTTGD